MEHIEDLAVAVSRLNARAIISDHAVFCFSRSNNIRNYSVSLFARENRVHIREWNELIQQAIEGGLIDLWSGERRNKSRRDSYVAFRPLKIHHLYGFFLIGLFLWIAAVSSFILELIIHRKLKCNNPHRFWKLADWLIDGRRHMMKLNRTKNPKQPAHLLPIRKYVDRIAYPHLIQPLPITWRSQRKMYVFNINNSMFSRQSLDT